MSRENVETVRRASELLGRRDWDGMTDLFDPNVELHGTVGGQGVAHRPEITIGTG
jgi:ketosteroid isomerase-like protein